MTGFRFRLERVLSLRRTQLQIAESACHQAEAAVHAIQAQYAALASAKSETRNSVARLTEVAGRTLEPLTYWFHWTETEACRLMNLEKSAARELQKRREAVVEAHRNVRLLEKLRDDRHAQWQSALDREMEEIAGDSINSRYCRTGRERGG